MCEETKQISLHRISKPQYNVTVLKQKFLAKIIEITIPTKKIKLQYFW